MHLPFLLAAIVTAPPVFAQLRPTPPLKWEGGVEASAYQDTDAVTVLTPTVHAKASERVGGWSAGGSYLVDVVSAASVDIVSTASPSWQEVRHAATLSVGCEPGEIGGTLSSAVSSEPDYLSLSAAARGTYVFAQKNARLGLGYSLTQDTAGRTGTPFSVYSLELVRHGLAGSLDLVLDRATTFTTSLDLMLESGRQEKPYRYLPLFDGATVSRVPRGAPVDLVNSLRLGARVSERLPDSRARGALSGRLAHRFAGSTLVLFDRAYVDGWGLWATTFDVRYVLELGRRFSVWPHGRAHVQSGTWFWRRAYVGEISSGSAVVPMFRSGDRELGPLFSGTLGPGARFDFGFYDPRDLSAILEFEGTYTRYADALYVEERWAGFGSLRIEMRLQ
jgi:hypothetical protein